mmetsp:Transcript_85270/g.219590  ORF Transcript_85270/g.219590 Transcript_85270/m.219590 type:complete len:282 (+) Transcript_85270:298-1143(+)
MSQSAHWVCVPMPSSRHPLAIIAVAVKNAPPRPNYALLIAHSDVAPVRVYGDSREAVRVRIPTALAALDADGQVASVRQRDRVSRGIYRASLLRAQRQGRAVLRLAHGADLDSLQADSLLVSTLPQHNYQRTRRGPAQCMDRAVEVYAAQAGQALGVPQPHLAEHGARGDGARAVTALRASADGRDLAVVGRQGANLLGGLRAVAQHRRAARREEPRAHDCSAVCCHHATHQPRLRGLPIAKRHDASSRRSFHMRTHAAGPAGQPQGGRCQMPTGGVRRHK